MIASISGNVINKNPNSLIVETNGVGYLIYVASEVVASVNINDPIKLMTYMVVREDTQALYGFLTMAEHGLFSMFVSVSGIGPKVALAILSSAKTEELKTAISRNDSAIFTAISGVGQKTAERLILELKSKIGFSADSAGSSDSAEVISALSGLGYNMYEIRQVLGKVSIDSSLENKVKEALKLLS